VLAVFPLDIVAFHAFDTFIVPDTGHNQYHPILSALLNRQQLSGLNFDALDCVQAVSSFPHRCDFGKVKGFRPVEILQLDGETPEAA